MRRRPAWAPRAAFATLFVLLAPGAPATAAGWPGDPTLSGYVRESPFLWSAPALPGATPSGSSTHFTDLVHTREELRLHFPPAVSLGLDLKTRLFAGETARELVDLADLTAAGSSYFDWERRFVDERRAVLVSTLDRAWITGEAGPVQVTLGRQRVAWGTALVWNPIDILNPVSPLDFDNEEKPGSDAARVQWYLGPSSKLDLAVAPMRRADDAVAAAEIVVNRAGVDWVAMGGRRGPAAVLGGAWSGSLGGGGFRGEFLYTNPRDGLRLPGADAPERANVVGTLDGDYTFANTLYLHGALHYNGRGGTGDAGGALLLEAYRRRWASPARLSLFAEAAKDLHPLVRADLATLLNPYDGSWYAGPTLTWSVVTNLDLSVVGLAFGGAAGTEFGDDGGILMARLKWSF